MAKWSMKGGENVRELTKRISIRLNTTQYEELRNQADFYMATLSDYAREAICYYLEISDKCEKHQGERNDLKRKP